MTEGASVIVPQTPCTAHTVESCVVINTKISVSSGKILSLECESSRNGPSLPVSKQLTAHHSSSLFFFLINFDFQPWNCVLYWLARTSSKIRNIDCLSLFLLLLKGCGHIRSYPSACLIAGSNDAKCFNRYGKSNTAL